MNYRKYLEQLAETESGQVYLESLVKKASAEKDQNTLEMLNFNVSISTEMNSNFKEYFLKRLCEVLTEIDVGNEDNKVEIMKTEV